MAGKYTQTQAYLSYLRGKTVAILGYNQDGQEEAENLKGNGIRVVIGLRPVDDDWQRAKEDGFDVMTLEEAVKEADIIQAW
ncbi:hypothetical protein BSNK01_26870 [Bacillaceae bacterium]